MDKEERVYRANEKVHRLMALPEHEGVKDFWKCHLKGGMGSGKLFVTKSYLIFISSGLVGRTTKVFPMSDLLDLSLVGKTLSVVTQSQPPPKQFVFEKFDGGEEGLGHCFKTIKRIFFGINGNGVLHTAVNDGDYQKVRQILDYRVQALEDLNRNGYSSLSLACEKNDLRMVTILLEYYQKNVGTVDINQTLPQGDHVLHIACRVSKIDNQILKQLLGFPNIDVSAKISYDDTTPLHYFCAYNHSFECQEIGELFLKNGASPNAKTHHGETPLHKAIFNNAVRVFMVKMLIAHGASADIKGGSRGDTPLHYAIRLNRSDLVQELLAAGVDMSIMNNEGDTVLQAAMKEAAIEKGGQIQEIIQMLKDVEALNNLLKSADSIELSKDFIREKMFSREVLITLTEQDLINAPFDIKLGQRIKLAQRLEVFKKEVAQQEADLKNQQEVNLKAQQAAKAEKEKEEVAALLQGRGEHHVDADNLRQLGVDDKWEIPVDSIEFTAKLGAGASGQVFKGLYKGKEVAIKVLNATDFDDQLEEFKKEFDILRKVNSPYMITFYGAVIERNLSMVMELCERGSLYDVLIKTWSRLLSFARDMAEGISVLHNLDPEPIIHRDLKSLNLLVTKDWRVKVCDFGLSRSVNKGNLETFKKLRGTFAYCAPEVFKGESCTAKSDIFSMGIVIWELMHVGVFEKYQQPYAEFGLHIDFQIIVQTAQGLRPTIPLGCPLDFVEVFAMCVGPEVADRATAKEVARRIQRSQSSYESDPVAWRNNAYTEDHKPLYTFTSTSNFGNHPAQASNSSNAGFKGWGGKASTNAPAPGPAPETPAFKGWGNKSTNTTSPTSTTSESTGDSGKHKQPSGLAATATGTRRRDSRAPKPEHHNSSSGMQGSKKK